MPCTLMYPDISKNMSKLKKQDKQMVNSKKERQARDGIGSTVHELANCETLLNSLFTPMT